MCIAPYSVGANQRHIETKNYFVLLVVVFIPCIILLLVELCLALIDAANDKQHEVRQMIMTSLHELGKKQPEMVLSAIKGYLIKHQKVYFIIRYIVATLFNLFLDI